MKKWIIKQTGTVVTEGECIEITCKLSKDTADLLIQMGIIEEKEDKITPAKCLDEVLTRICKKQNWDSKKLEYVLSSIGKINPYALFSMLLKEVAIFLDEKYEGHIKYAKDIFLVDIITMKSFKLDEIPPTFNYSSCAVFRTEEDANFALEALKPLIVELPKSR